MTAENEVFKITIDPEMRFLYNTRTEDIKQILGNDRSFLMHTNSFGAGGCVPAGTSIEAPGGEIQIESLRTGTIIFSADIDHKNDRIRTRVIHVYCSKEPECIRVNGRALFTPSQALYVGNGSWVRAGDLVPGCEIETADARSYSNGRTDKKLCRRLHVDH